MSEHMETDSRKIVDNILSDMAELNDWICIADATGANGKTRFMLRMMMSLPSLAQSKTLQQ